MLTAGENSTLRYLEASRIQGPSGELVNADVRAQDDENIGTLDGVLIDPVERRLKFLVVQSPGWLRPRRYLLPTDWPAKVDDDGSALRVEVDKGEVDRCQKFDRSAVSVYSDDDLLATIFRRRIA